MNIVTLLGNVGRDPETRFSQSGMAITNLSLATNKKVKGEAKTQWHKLVAFDKTAELIEKYIKKGSQLGVEGELSYGNYEKEGVKIYTTEIIVNKIHFIKGVERQENREPTEEEMKTPPAPPEEDDSQIPF